MDDTNGVAGTKRRIQIKVPEQYLDVNDEVWKDLEEYLFTGFLVSQAQLLGQDFVFKTLNHQEVKNIWYLRRSSKSEEMFKAMFIAYSIFVANGTNVLYDRPEHVGKLVELILKVPVGYQDKIVDNLNSLNKRANRLYPLVEVYVHESRSRYKWLFLKKLPLHSVEATGIPGTVELGMNYCQQSWTALNEVLDKKETTEIDWNHAKFIGSCFAGKGMASIDEQDKARRNREKQELDELKMKVLNEYMNSSRGKVSEMNESTVSLPDGRRAVVEGRFKAESVEELADQLSSALSGEKDHHDKVVEEHFRKAKAEQETLAKQNRQFAAMPRNLLESGEPATGGARVLNKGEADAYVKRMQALMINASATPTSPPDVDMDRSDLRGKRNG